MFNRKKKEPICCMVGRPCPRRGLNGLTPDTATVDYCPAWLVLDHRVSEAEKLRTGREVERIEGCAHPLQPFVQSGAISAANAALAEVVEARKETSLGLAAIHSTVQATSVLSALLAPPAALPRGESAALTEGAPCEP